MCRDGFTFSVIAGAHCYCIPRPGWIFGGCPPEDYRGPYTHVEVGFMGFDLPKPMRDWREYAECLDARKTIDHVSVFAFVPKRLVYSLMRLHGGEIEPYEWQPQEYQRNRWVRNRNRQMVRMQGLGMRLRKDMESKAVGAAVGSGSSLDSAPSDPF